LKKKVFSLLALIITSILMMFLFMTVPTLNNSRFGIFFERDIENPINAIHQDASATARLNHILVSHRSLLHNYGLGHGLGTWATVADTIILDSSDFVQELVAIHFYYSSRPFSGWGTAIFELGVVGVFLVLSFIYLMIRGYWETNIEFKSVYISSLITIYFVMLMAVPLAFPLFGYMIGVFVYLQSDFQEKIKGAEKEGLLG